MADRAIPARHGRGGFLRAKQIAIIRAGIEKGRENRQWQARIQMYVPPTYPISGPNRLYRRAYYDGWHNAYRHERNVRFTKLTKRTPVWKESPRVSTSTLTQPTDSSKTIIDSITTLKTKPLEGHNMTETNRQSALSAATYSLPNDRATSTDAVLARAEAFLAWLDNEGTTQAPPTPAPTAQRDAFADVIDLAERNREQWGNLAVDTIRDRARALVGRPYEQAIQTAIGAVGDLGFGRHLTEAVTEQLQALLTGEQRPAAATTPAVPRGNIGDQILGVVDAAIRQYGEVARPLRNAVLAGPLTKEGAISSIYLTREYSDYPTQVSELIRQIRRIPAL